MAEASCSKPSSTRSASSGSTSSSGVFEKEPGVLEAGLGFQEKATVQENEIHQDEGTSPLKKTTSNVLTKVASHMTTRSIIDPGPPPDGGITAWTQVMCGWIVNFSTWGMPFPTSLSGPH